MPESDQPPQPPQPPFVPGLELSRRFYHEVVGPIVAAGWPTLPYSAALLGPGSEVLGFDTPRSTDHEWGPRLQIFLSPAAEPTLATAIADTLGRALPHRFLGFPTGFGPPDDEGVRLPLPTSGETVAHKVEVTTLPQFLRGRLGVDHYDKMRPLDWLLCSEQSLLEVTAGALFHDGLGELARARAALAYYPRDVWLFLLAAQWTRIGQQEAFVGRTGEVGDDLGSRLITAGLVRDLMRLCFLLGRRYAPYAKWFGTAFGRLAVAPRLRPALGAALAAPDWPAREHHLGAAYEIVLTLQNDLGLTAPIPTTASPFHGRPFRVIHGGRVAAALRAAIGDERVRAWPIGLGAIDQIADATDLLENPPLRRRLRPLYES